MGVRRFNIVNVTIYLLIAAAVYASFKYVPIVWKKTQLETIVKEASYLAKRNSEERVRNTIIREAQQRIHVVIDPEDVEVEKLQDRVKIFVVWRPVVEHPMMEPAEHAITIEQETLYF